MKKRFESIVLIVCLGILVYTLMMILIVNNSVLDIKVEIEENGRKEYISLWDNGGELVVFLPNYADFSSIKFKFDDNTDLFIDGIHVDDFFEYSKLQTNHVYEVKYKLHKKDHAGFLVFLKSGNVATMYIDTDSGSMDYIHGKKRNSEAGNLRLYEANGNSLCDVSINSIAGRGNTTWDEHEKKPYTIDLDDAVSLMGMAASQKWVLLANAKDSSHIRNKIIFDFADEVGLDYSPKGEWVNLYLNGEYAGLYLLTEKNEVNSTRIDIEDDRSFLISVERKGRMVTQNIPYILTQAEQALRIRYPQNPTSEQVDVLKREWQSIENAILDENGIDKATGKSWLDLIDLESWAKKYLIEEVFGNLDACFISQYFYRDGTKNDERVYAGPVWDYDITMGLAWQTDKLDFMIANRLSVQKGYQTPWFYELYKKDEFYKKIQEIYKNEFVPLLEQIVEEKIDVYANSVSDAARMDSIRWNTGEFDSEIEKIRSFLKRRIRFLSDYWLEEQKYYIIEACSEGVSHAYFAVKNGECVAELPMFEDTDLRTFLGWYYENGEPFDYSKKITKDEVIYAKWSGIPSFFTVYGEYFMPLMVIACIGVCVLFAEIRRSCKSRGIKNER